jgi:broad specificity phosphatase PhoE
MAFYFIRHAQSEFNVIFMETRIDPIMYDSVLSPFGMQQAVGVKNNIAELNITRVIVSPFIRTLQTASQIFGDDYPFEVSHGVREQLSNSCDVGSHRDVLKEKYPHLEFGHLPDVWWHQGELDERGLAVEPHEVLIKRTDAYLKTLKPDANGSTAIVTHGNFIHAVTGEFTVNCEIVKIDLDTREFQSINGSSLA